MGRQKSQMAPSCSTPPCSPHPSDRLAPASFNSPRTIFSKTSANTSTATKSSISVESNHTTSRDDLHRPHSTSTTTTTSTAVARVPAIDIHGPPFDGTSPPSQGIMSSATSSTTAPNPATTTPTTTPLSPTNRIASSKPHSRLPTATITSSSTLRELIPPFHFPHGRPTTDDVAACSRLDAIRLAFLDTPTPGTVTLKDMTPIAKACGYTKYWRSLLYRYACTDSSDESISCEDFISAWKRLTKCCHDDPSRFVRLMSEDECSYLLEDDFIYLLKDIVQSHPGLSFLDEKFHLNYIITVISRIYYTVNRSWSGKITVQEIRNSNLLSVLDSVGENDNMNQILDYFSYEHFYVIYCKFWALDNDHDLHINCTELARHDNQTISYRLIERIFSGVVTRKLVNNCMKYKDFVWFLLSEEDKTSPTSIEYWFRCLDLDGDGKLTLYEMQYFCDEQIQKLISLGYENLKIEDQLCQLLDMANPVNRTYITLSDLKRSANTSQFLNTLFNFEKYFEGELGEANFDPRDRSGEQDSDWNKFASNEYQKLVTEEKDNYESENEYIYEDDFHDDED